MPKKAHDLVTFGGDTFDKDKDGVRLASALETIRALLTYRFGLRVYTLHALARAANCSEASASARLRDLRKPKFGGLNIQKKRDATRPGIWWYWLEDDK